MNIFDDGMIPPPPEYITGGELRASILALNEDARRAAESGAWGPGMNYTEDVNGLPNTVEVVPTLRVFAVPAVHLEAADLTPRDVPFLVVIYPEGATP